MLKVLIASFFCAAITAGVHFLGGYHGHAICSDQQALPWLRCR